MKCCPQFWSFPFLSNHTSLCHSFGVEGLKLWNAVSKFMSTTQDLEHLRTISCILCCPSLICFPVSASTLPRTTNHSIVLEGQVNCCEFVTVRAKRFPGTAGLFKFRLIIIDYYWFLKSIDYYWSLKLVVLQEGHRMKLNPPTIYGEVDKYLNGSD